MNMRLRRRRTPEADPKPGNFVVCSLLGSQRKEQPDRDIADPLERILWYSRLRRRSDTGSNQLLALSCENLMFCHPPCNLVSAPN